MGRFAPRPVCFGRRPDDQDDDAERLPTPQRVKLLARRQAGIAEARQVLKHLPGPGESLHAVTSSRMDLADILDALLSQLGRCDRMTIATLGYGEQNRRMMLGWLDAGAVGELTLLASIFFKAHNNSLWERTLEEFRERKQRAACAPSHCKVVALSFASGERLSLEGSANLRGSGSVKEQVAIINHPDLCEWHSRWIADLVVRYEGRDANE